MLKTAIGTALAAAAMIFATAAGAQAASHPLFGQRLIIKNKLPEDESKNRVVFSTRGAVVSPAPGSGGDPTCAGAGGGGATLEIKSPTSGESLSVSLPCAGWEQERRGNGYKYRERQLAQSPCRSVQIKDGRYVKATCQGRGASVLDFDLSLGVHQAPIDVTLRLGSTPEIYCAQWGGHVRKNGTDGKTFLAARSNPPAACPVP
jgi:hypothetical protein